MKFINFKRKLAAGIAVLSALVLAPAAVSAATNATNAANAGPQAPLAGKAAKITAAVANQCTYLKQMNPTEQKYRLAYNAPVTYTDTSGNFFNVKCGLLTFTVPRGQDSMVDFTAAAELDCQAPNSVVSSSPTNGWCESRFLVNTVNVLPNNSGRGDTFAWDSSNGGNFDWQANTLEQVGHAWCPISRITQAPCTFHAQLQARLDNGATSLWVDDLTIRVDVSEGTVTVASIAP